MNKAKPLTKECLTGFKYSPKTGILYRNKSLGNAKAGPMLGKTVNGYISFMHKGKHIYAHRAALVLSGYDVPEDRCVDHLDGNKTNNKLSNLRLVTNRENQCNQVNHRSGRLHGVSWIKRDKIWRSQIKINGKKKSLGSYATEQEAHEAYLLEKNKL